MPHVCACRRWTTSIAPAPSRPLPLAEKTAPLSVEVITLEPFEGVALRARGAFDDLDQAFGAIFTWFMIFLTHYCFRRYHQRHGEKKLSFRMRFFPYTTLLGLVLMGAVMITTYFTDAFKMTLVFGVPFLLILSAVYYGFFRKGRAKASSKALA